jgi:hypothetical protein
LCPAYSFFPVYLSLSHEWIYCLITQLPDNVVLVVLFKQLTLYLSLYRCAYTGVCTWGLLAGVKSGLVSILCHAPVSVWDQSHHRGIWPRTERSLRVPNFALSLEQNILNNKNKMNWAYWYVWEKHVQNGALNS